MPTASKKQCKSPKGFSQIASCKAQGFIPRTSKKNKGKYIVSPKYKKKSKKRYLKGGAKRRSKKLNSKF